MSHFAEIFDENASGYEKFRPGYPQEIADRIVDVVSLTPGASILEIGCGTGQATGFFERFEPHQTCIDPGERLLEACKNRYPQYNFFCGKFENFESESDSFDLIYAATSFHWITKGLRFTKAASLLNEGGHLVVLTDQHTKNLGGFFADVEPIYKRLAPDLYSPFQQPASPEQEENPLALIDHFETDRELQYSADDYIGLLRTFSGHIALGEDRLSALCDEIHALIERRHNGRIAKTLTTYTSIYGAT